MAAIGTAVTLLDITKRLDPNGKVDKIAEVLTQQNQVLEDMLWVEGNLLTGHKTTIRTGLPDATWRLLNYGVASSKSTTAQVTDTCGMLEAYSTIDKSLADLNRNAAEFRASEDKAFLESMSQSFAGTLLYGDIRVNPERFHGLAPRFADLDATADQTEIAYNVIAGDASPSGADNTSIWLIGWGDQTVHGIYPQGSMAGWHMKDLGEQTVYDANNNPYQAYRTHYKWDCGLTVRDWRYIVRGCNIDVSQLLKTGATGTDIIDLMTQMLEKLPSLGTGKPVFYANRTVLSMLRRQIVNKVAASTLSSEMVGGKPVTFFAGVPVKRCDQILNTESSLT